MEKPPSNTKSFLIIALSCISVVGSVFLVASLSRSPEMQPQEEQPQQATSSSTALLPEIADFLKNTQSFGTVDTVTAEPDWANGPRQRVSFSDGGSYLFYIKSGKVITVWKDNPAGGRDVAWGKTDSE